MNIKTVKKAAITIFGMVVLFSSCDKEVPLSAEELAANETGSRLSDSRWKLNKLEETLTPGAIAWALGTEKSTYSKFADCNNDDSIIFESYNGYGNHNYGNFERGDIKCDSIETDKTFTWRPRSGTAYIKIWNGGSLLDGTSSYTTYGVSISNDNDTLTLHGPSVFINNSSDITWRSKQTKLTYVR